MVDHYLLGDISLRGVGVWHGIVLGGGFLCNAMAAVFDVSGNGGHHL